MINPSTTLRLASRELPLKDKCDSNKTRPQQPFNRSFERRMFDNDVRVRYLLTERLIGDNYQRLQPTREYFIKI